jgi:hypothetical protein
MDRMTETVQIHDTGPGQDWLARPRLEAVPDAPAPAATRDEPKVLRNSVVGAAVGFAVVAIAITVIGTLGGLGAGNAAGLGTFVGMWSGVGYGFMVGATVPLARHLDARHAARSTALRSGDAGETAGR